MAKIEKIKADVLSASYSNGKLLIYAAGNMPDSCISSTRITKAKIAVEPPRFVLERVLNDGQVCADKITPWQFFDVFEIGPFRSTVVIDDSSGPHEVPVADFKPLPDVPAVTQPKGGGGEVPVPFVIGEQLKKKLNIATSVGHSDSMSFDDALQDAIKKLPPGPQIPDYLDTYKVTGISVEFGGIVGVARLRVEIKRSSPE